MSSAFREDPESALSFPALFFIPAVPWGFHSCSSRTLCRLDPPCPPAPGSSVHHGSGACFTLGSQKTFIMSLGYSKHHNMPHTSDWLQGPRGWQAGPDSALAVERADFLTLQGTVWSRWLDGGHEAQRGAGAGRTTGGKDMDNRGVPDQVSIGSDDGVVCCGSTGSMWREMTLSCGKIILLSH